MPERKVETILVIDDNDFVLNATDARLIRHGYRVIACLSGKHALLLLREWTDLELDLALIDIVMPDAMGPDVANEIRQTKPHLPIIFMTGFPEHQQSVASLGRVVISKPFSSLTVIEKIRQTLDRPAAPRRAASSRPLDPNCRSSGSDALSGKGDFAAGTDQII